MMHQLIPLLKSLRLSGIMETLELRNKEAIERKVSYIEFFLRFSSRTRQKEEISHDLQQG